MTPGRIGRKPRHHRPFRLQGLPQGPRRTGKKDVGLIGQFGVGFYAAFMVAKTVTVYSHSWRKDEPAKNGPATAPAAIRIEESSGERRGAKIVIELKDDCSGVQPGLADQGNPRALQRLCLRADQPQRQTDQYHPGPLAPEQETRSRRKSTPSLQIPGPRLRRAPPAACTSAPMLPSRSTPCSSSQGQHREARHGPAGARGRPLTAARS